jgi:mono/diheme cytochrome c family protein
MQCMVKWILISSLMIVSAAGLVYAAAGDGTWLTKVPAKERQRENPYAQDPKAASAGAKLFEENCAACHGANAEGKGNKPDLRSDRIQQASPGELHWLLTNGSLKNGMPSWTRLPDQQRWQIVTYLKSLP